MDISFPSDTKDYIDRIREAIGRDVNFFYVASETPCTYSGCTLDPVTNTSTLSLCPVCSGRYWIPVYSGYPTIAHITWGNFDTLGWVTGGQYFEGDCRIQIEYTLQNLDIVNKAEYVVVDDKEMLVSSKVVRGVPNINRILINLIERE